MRILLITQIFPPEMGALANRMYPIVQRLVAAGHEVFVATGMPSYPEGVVFPEYRGKRTFTERRDGFTVLRTAYYTTPRNRSKGSQLRSYLSFVPAALRSGLRAGPVDVVFVTSPPIFPVIAGALLAKRRKARLVFDIRDLWPDEIVACGASKENSLPVRLVRAIERWTYRNADCISCTTQAFIDTVVERGAPREKTIFTPNGADLELFRPVPADNPVAAAYPFGDRTVVMYSGLLGIKHGLETILEAARLLSDDPGIVFFLRGNGPKREALVRLAAERGLNNVVFGGEHPIEDLPYLTARADICLATLLPDPYLEKIISVKIFEYLACARPVVAGLAGEGARVIRESGGGIVVAPGDPAALANAVRELSADPARRAAMGEKGRSYVRQHYSRQVVAERLERNLRALCSSGQENPDSVRARSESLESGDPATPAS